MSANVEELTQLVKDLEKALYNLTMVIVEVRALHTPEESSDGEYHCTACYDEWGYYEDYPCPTVKALGDTK